MALARPDWGSAATEYPADKGLNCAENIFHALKNGDGYIFSKSVKQLPEIERTWVLLSNDYRDIKDDNGVFLAEPVSNFIGGTACFVTMYFTVWKALS